MELDSDPLAVPPARPSSGRVSGLRGQLLSRQGGAATPLATPLRSSSDPHLPTFLDDQPPRLKTAVSGHPTLGRIVVLSVCKVTYVEASVFLCDGTLECH